jgi:hypothetical protein
MAKLLGEKEAKIEKRPQKASLSHETQIHKSLCLLFCLNIDPEISWITIFLISNSK